MKRWIPFVLGASLLFVGCAGAGLSGAMLGALVLVATLVLAACEGEDPAEQVITTDADATSTPDTVTETTLADAIADQSDDGCSGAWEMGCSNGQLVPMCCPAGWACNYGWSVPCNGICIDASETCPSPDAIDETTETTETVSDTDDDATATTDTDDGDVSCDGTWESACVEGVVTPMCCPAGMACNYGEFLVHCGDGTCVLSPETCPP